MYSCPVTVLKQQVLLWALLPFQSTNRWSGPQQPPTAFPEFRWGFIDFEARKSNFRATSLSRLKGTYTDNVGSQLSGCVFTPSFLKQCPSSIFTFMLSTRRCCLQWRLTGCHKGVVRLLNTCSPPWDPPHTQPCPSFLPREDAKHPVL